MGIEREDRLRSLTVCNEHNYNIRGDVVEVSSSGERADVKNRERGGYMKTSKLSFRRP